MEEGFGLEVSWSVNVLYEFLLRIWKAPAKVILPQHTCDSSCLACCRNCVQPLAPDMMIASLSICISSTYSSTDTAVAHRLKENPTPNFNDSVNYS